MSVRLTVSPCALLDPGGAGGATVTRRETHLSLPGDGADAEGQRRRRAHRPTRTGGSSPSALKSGLKVQAFEGVVTRAQPSVVIKVARSRLVSEIDCRETKQLRVGEVSGRQ